MAKQIINIGASANDGTGDPLRNAFDKTNDNFNELYLALGSSTNPIDLFDNNGALDLQGKPHKVTFYYDTKAALDLVSPGTYHGAVGHAHDTGALYYAHGSWRKLLTDTSDGASIANYTDPLNKFVYTANITNAEQAGYVLSTNANNSFTWVAAAAGAGNFSNTAIDLHINTAAASNNEVLSWNGTDYAWINPEQNAFSRITIGGTNIDADATSDALTLVAGTNITLTANTSSDTIEISASGGGGGSNSVNLNSVDAGVINQAADSIAFIDADDSGNTKKETVADFMAAVTDGSSITVSNGVASVASSIQYTDAKVDAHLNTSGASSGQILSWNGSDYAWVADQTGGGGGSVSNTDIINAVTASDLDMGGNRVLFGNLYSTEGDLPNASTYHGMFAHVHATGAGYFAHAGNWVRLANQSELGGGGSGASRVSETETTSSIADGASGNVQFSTLGKSFALQKVTVDKECWVRIYSDTASRTADSGRSQGTDPADGSGVIAEFISTTSGSQEFKITPSIMGWLDDNETEVPVAVQNNSGSTGTVQVTIDVLKLES